MRAILQEASALLKKILESEDLEEAVREHLGEIDDAFLAVLSANIEQAEGMGEKEKARKLKRLADLTFELLQERAPRPIRLINQLLNAQYPRETKRLLEENVEQVDNRFIKTLELIIENLSQRGQKRAARHLREVKDQAWAMLKQPSS